MKKKNANQRVRLGKMQNFVHSSSRKSSYKSFNILQLVIPIFSCALICIFVLATGNYLSTDSSWAITIKRALNIGDKGDTKQMNKIAQTMYINSNNSSVTNYQKETPQAIEHQVVELLESHFDDYEHDLQKVQELLSQHPIRFLEKEKLQGPNRMKLEEVMSFLQAHKNCDKKPIIMSMASVGTDLYWQLIENFVYSMVKFDFISCSIMVCVSDPKCMKLCDESTFPCYDYRHEDFNPGKSVPSVMEQIGELKLKHTPKALNEGVNIFVLDLDVGFIGNPTSVVNQFMASRNDVYVQKDISFVMNRSLEGWRTWYTVPLPNIGLFMCKGNKKTVKMFAIAWQDYQTITAPIKHNPGKDQNKVVNAMRSVRWSDNLRWAYVPENAAVLLDKIYKFQVGKKTYELGGRAAEEILSDTGALFAHTTCYEQKMKVMGLKAANAFWNPKYYNPKRRTLTKKLLYGTEIELLQEVRTMVYLAVVSNRTLIIPNVLGHDRITTVDYYLGKAMWPGFRVLYVKKDSKIGVDIVEPAFYWRVQRDYSKIVPPPKLAVLTVESATKLAEIEKLLLSPLYNDHPRIVMHSVKKRYVDAAMAQTDIDEEVATLNWAMDSVGTYRQHDIESAHYVSIPKLSAPRYGGVKRTNLAYDIIHDTRLCNGVFARMKGNRSCFDKCD